MIPTPRIARQRGFTLAELAIVFVIVALLIGGTVLTLAAQTEAREITDTQRTLEQARDAIMGFALRNGRLPCPAPAAGNAIESFCTNGGAGACGPIILAPPVHGRCSSPNGFVPAATLGIGPIETNPASPNFGLLLDSWLQPIRYSVTQVFSPTPPPNTVMLFTAPGEMRSNILASPPIAPDLVVCTTSAGVDPVGVGPAFLPTCAAGAPNSYTPAVVFSTGKNASAGVGNDELANTNGDRVFVARPPTPFNPAPAAGFDDLVIWISPNILYNRLIAGGAI